MCKEDESGGLFLRNRCNHFLLNKILVARYHSRKSALVTKLIIYVELFLVKTGIIYKGN